MQLPLQLRQLRQLPSPAHPGIAHQHPDNCTHVEALLAQADLVRLNQRRTLGVLRAVGGGALVARLLRHTAQQRRGPGGWQ